MAPTRSWRSLDVEVLPTLIDTNVILDILTNDVKWADGSIHQLEKAALRGPMLLNAVVYAELSVRFPTIEAQESVLRESGLTMTQIPRPALFLAGKIFLDYRSRGGALTGVPPDFFIGAHAAVSGCDLLTRDPRRYRTYFPNVPVVSP